MAFEKGTSGNPGGRPAEKPWRDALKRVLAQYKTADIRQGEALRVLAERVVMLALAGDKDAYTEIGNRLDGRPPQAIEVSGEVEHFVARTPTVSPTTETWQKQHKPTVQ